MNKIRLATVADINRLKSYPNIIQGKDADNEKCPYWLEPEKGNVTSYHAVNYLGDVVELQSGSQKLYNRPILEIDDLDSLNLQIGQVLKLFNLNWYYIGDNRLFAVLDDDYYDNFFEGTTSVSDAIAYQKKWFGKVRAEANIYEEFTIENATLLSVEETDQIPLRLRKYKSWWWLRSPGFYQYIASFVNYDGSVYYYGNNVNNDNGCVRPALKISNPESVSLHIGDTFDFGGSVFEVISEDLAFCRGDIGGCAFRNATAAPDANDYEKSDVKKYVDDWFNKSIKNK